MGVGINQLSNGDKNPTACTGRHIPPTVSVETLNRPNHGNWSQVNVLSYTKSMDKSCGREVWISKRFFRPIFTVLVKASEGSQLYFLKYKLGTLTILQVRDWSLITGRGGGYRTGGGGHVKFYPYEKGGEAEKVLAILKGGGGARKVLW